MRWPGLLLRIVGWLLTPFVAWAASFFAAWGILGLLPASSEPRRDAVIVLGTGLVLAVLVLLVWMRLLRRSPRLRHSLHVTREGLPVMDPDRPGADEPSAGERPG